MTTPSQINSRSEFFHLVPGGPVFRLADERGLLGFGADLGELCKFYRAHLTEIHAHRLQWQRERALNNLPGLRR